MKWHLQHIAEILVLELRLVLHPSLVTHLLICRAISTLSVSVGEKHVCWKKIISFSI
jgi:hypothetical protein